MPRQTIAFTLALLTLATPLLAEPVENAANEFGRWRTAEPGRFVPLNDPAYLPARAAKLADDAQVIGLVVGDDARAFPLRLMTYHHVVNDTIGGDRVAVTYCGMANTAVTYRLGDGVGNLEAGGLFGGVLAMREQGSTRCWAQIAEVPLPDDAATTSTLAKGQRASITNWRAWRTAHPATRVLAPVEDFDIRYEAYDLASHTFTANPLMNSSVTRVDDRLDSGVEIFGLARNGKSWACPISRIRELGKVDAELDGAIITVTWDAALETPAVPAAFEGFAMRAYWYAWSQFYPATEIGK
jgi:hypothetical protein